jgi:hypothetical protein
MKLRHFFTVNIFFAIFFGLTCSLFPVQVGRLYDLAFEESAIWTTRLLGGSILGFAILMWFGRKSKSAETRRAIAMALLAQDTIGFIASMEIQIGGKINAFGWTNPILYGLLAIGYAYFLFIRPDKS